MAAEDTYLSIGSNLGDRSANISEALFRLDAALGCAHAALSSIIETKAWGFDGPDFLDCVVLYKTDISPIELLHICKQIERSMGREDSVQFDSGGRRIYHSRIIDIDILLYGDLKIDTPELKIPHPLMEKRDFIMRPLRELLK